MTRRYTGGFLSAKEQATDANTANGIFSVQDAAAATAAGSFPTGRWTPQRSLRFRAAVTAYLNRTYGTPTNNKVWTWSAWVKRGSLSLADANHLFLASPTDVGGNPSTYTRLVFETDHTLRLQSNASASEAFTSSSVFRDPSAWYHIVLYMDAVNTTVRCYVNGTEITYASKTNPTNTNTAINGSGNFHRMGLFRSAETRPFDGYMADVNFVDGQALTPSAFGMTDSETGVWVPKRYTGTYGNNGFYLDFRDNTSTTNLALDRSGNSNNFTPNNISVTAGTTYDSMVDVPGIASVSSQADIGGVQRGNYCTLNPLDIGGGGMTLSNANLSYTNSGTQIRGTIGTDTSSKWYWEFTNGTTATPSTPVIFGISTLDGQITNNTTAFRLAAHIYTDGGSNFTASFFINGTNVSYITTQFRSAEIGDIFQVAYDAATGKLWFGKNNTWYDGVNSTTGNPSTGSNPVYTLPIGNSMTPLLVNVGATYSGTLNCGQRAFVYTPPTGFKSLNTTNLPDPVIKRPSEHFDVKTWTGNGSNILVGATQKQTSTYAINKSLKFRKANSAYLSRTPPTSGNQKTWTWSGWVKQSLFGTSGTQWLLTAGNAGSIANNYTTLSFSANGFLGNANQLQFFSALSNSTVLAFESSQRFGNPTEWCHVVLAVDTTQINQTNRVKLYADGVQITSFATATYPGLNVDIPFINNSSVETRIGAIVTYGSFDGYMADVNFVEGQSLTPASFGAFDANNNWVPQRYAGTYGTNGYYLPMNTTASGFSGYYGEFNLTPTAQYLSVPDSTAIQFQTGNFTQECYFYLKGPNPASTTFYSIWGSYDDVSTGQYLHINDAGRLTWGTNGSIYITTANAVPKYQWNHVALVRSTSTLVTLYLNGKNVGSIDSGSGTLITGVPFRIGSLSNSFPRYFPGLISNFRYTKSAVYTAEFVPPTGTLTAIANTQLLLLTGASATTDGSTNNMTVTNVGTVTTKAGNVGAYVSIGNDASGNNDHWDLVAINPQPAAVEFRTPGTTTWTAPPGITSVNYLVVAGGGGGGYNIGGGGGAGGLLQGKLDVTPGTSYTVTVGAGGAGNTGGGVGIGTSGGNSVFSTITTVGGGGGGGNSSGSPGQDGGSGGGAGEGAFWGVGTAGQGFRGGQAYDLGQYYGSGGGGGAGGVGENGTSSKGGNGGPGLASFITGLSKFYAGGGGGGYYPTGGGQASGGSGIGGASGAAVTSSGGAGSSSTGSGGGGGSNTAFVGSGGNGANGIVILSYGAGNDSTYDSPTDNIADVLGTSGGTGNHAIIDFNERENTNVTVSNAGLTVSNTASASHASFRSSIKLPANNGKIYWEVKVNGDSNTRNSAGINLQSSRGGSSSSLTGFHANTAGWYFSGTNSWDFGDKGTTGVFTLANGATGDIANFAYDAATGYFWVGRNGVWYNNAGSATGDPAAGTNPTAIMTSTFADYYVGGSVYSQGSGSTLDFNFGQQNFAYRTPTGFKALNSKNLKDVGSFNLPDTFGNFVNTPDLVWIKNRSATYNHILQDTTRGTLTYLDITNTGSTALSTGIEAFLPNGFQVGSVVGANRAGDNIVGWAWNRGKTPGFDIVTYAGNSSNGTMIPHNLGQVPAMYFTKCLTSYNNSNGFADWNVWHKSVDMSSYGGNKTLYLMNDIAAGTAGGYFANPTSSEFSPNQTSYDNVTGVSYIAYLWAEVPGFSRFGSYVGNGSADGPFVYTGFRPRWLMVKRRDSTSNWEINDTVRQTTNPVFLDLSANSAQVENYADGTTFDILSNGFKIRDGSSTGTKNVSTGIYIYAAFAENPFKYANAR